MSTENVVRLQAVVARAGLKRKSDYKLLRAMGLKMWQVEWRTDAGLRMVWVCDPDQAKKIIARLEAAKETRRRIERAEAAFK